MAEAAEGEGWTNALKIYLERRTLAMLALGFGGGLPFLLIFDTLSAWLRQAGVRLEVITLFNLATMAYAFKFLWAPVVDRTRVPWLTDRLGHRRSWMLASQAAIILGLLLIAGSEPASHLTLVGVLAVLTGFAGATQDIVMDAWRIEVAPENRQGAMAAAYQWGFRIGYIVAGAAPLLLADAFTWPVSYGSMALLMSIGVAGALIAPREVEHVIRALPRVDGPLRPGATTMEWLVRLAVLVSGAIILGSGLTGKSGLLAAMMPHDTAAALGAAWSSSPWPQFAAIAAGFSVIVLAAWPLPGKPTQPGLYLSHAFADPILDFVRRFGAGACLIIALICTYRLSEFVLNLMNPYYLDLGFTLTQIAEVRKIYGAVMFMLGVAVGGYAVARWGVMRALIVGAIIGPMSNLLFAWLTMRGPDVPALIITLGFNNVAQSFAGTCLIAYMSSLTSAGFTATQYALFSSLYALPDRFLGTQSGRIVEAAARSAQAGGVFAPLQRLLDGLPSGSFAAGAASLGVAPPALGAGYVTFFIYSGVVGAIALPLAIVVAARRPQAKRPAGAGTAG